jgi:hypothetical protein
MNKSGITVFVLGTAMLSGCGGSNVEGIQQQVAESFFVTPSDVKFSDIFENSDKVCGFASASVGNDRFVGPRPFWADANGGSMEIIGTAFPEQFLINAARDCPDQFVNLLLDFPLAELRASRQDSSSRDGSQ